MVLRFLALPSGGGGGATRSVSAVAVAFRLKTIEQARRHAGSDRERSTSAQLQPQIGIL